jgi:hypothetical protein
VNAHFKRILYISCLMNATRYNIVLLHNKDQMQGSGNLVLHAFQQWHVWSVDREEYKVWGGGTPKPIPLKAAGSSAGLAGNICH